MYTVTPDLASLFLDADAATLWSTGKLKDNHRFSQLHSKYWGERIEDEAERWRELNPIVNDPTNDIGAGCYALNLGFGFLPSKLWVRQDYVRVYDYCCRRYAEGPTTAGKIPRSVVITGQPGIGAFLSPITS
jgi:hypothetical protein